MPGKKENIISENNYNANSLPRLQLPVTKSAEKIRQRDAIQKE